MVYAEVEAPGVVGYYRAEAYFGVYFLEARAGKRAEGVAGGHIVEVAAYQHVGAAVVAYEAKERLRLPCSLYIGMPEFFDELHPNGCQILLLQIGEFSV